MEQPFGNYLLIEKIADGGMGEVFLAKQRGIAFVERLVVLKRLLPDFARQKPFLERFVREARISTRLAHPNIVQVYEFGRVEDCFYLTLEYVRGLTLSAITQSLMAVGAAWPLDVILEVIVRVCDGLGYVHNVVDVDGTPLGIVHCDVSPSNIMISDDGQVKLLDFGVARARGTAGQVGAREGKLGYMAPEQASGLAVDGRADLYSVGVVFWELLARRRLFPAQPGDQGTTPSVIPPVISPSELRKGLVPVIDDVVLTLLKQNRDLRFASANVVQERVEAIVRGLDLRSGSRLLQRFLATLRSLRDEATGSATRAQALSTVLGSTSAPPGTRLRRLRLLVVDDEPDNVAAMQRAFHGRYETFAATDPREALAMVEREKIDILVTDERMPYMNGVELIERSRRVCPNIVKVIVSAFSDSTTLLRAINSGNVDRFVTKPWLPEVLLTAVEEALTEQPISLEVLKSQVRRMTAELDEIPTSPAVGHDLDSSDEGDR